MTFEELQKIVSRISYKPRWKIRVLEFADSANYEFSIVSDPKEDAYYKQRLYKTYEENIIGPIIFRYTLDYDLLKDIDEEWVIKTIYTLIKDLELHELDEWFEVDGIKICNPHNLVEIDEKKAAVKQVSEASLSRKQE